MLSISNVKQINRQIADELNTADSICSSHQEKLEAIERIDALKKLLEDRHEVTMPPVPPPSIRTIFGVCR
jgi:hypothetical protein